jgi:glycosyltransferase involved in cell wall biosynthesis
VKRKGVAEFIENSLSGLIKDYPDLIYLIVGSGKNKSNIEDKIKKCALEKHVILLGNVSDETLHAAYSASDVFVMPNIKVPGNIEGFGIAALEASIYALPVVASDLEGIKDAVKEGINGFLIPCNDYISFKNRINFLLQNNEAREELGKKGQQYAKKFSWENISAQYLDIIKASILK